MRDLVAALGRLLKEDDAQDLVEYSLLIAFIALVCIALLNGASTSIRSIMSGLNRSLSTANSFAS